MAKVMPLNNQDGAHHGWMIFCPGCCCGHLFDSRWTYNGDANSPTFRASMLVNGSFTEEERKKHNMKRCHSFVTDGKIQFLDDCDHAMKNQTVDLPDFDTIGDDW